MRSITQTLPFELEEQLLVPVDSLVSDFTLVGPTADGGGRVIAFSAEQDLLAGLLAGLQGRSDPEVITATVMALAACVARDNPPGRQLLLFPPGTPGGIACAHRRTRTAALPAPALARATSPAAAGERLWGGAAGGWRPLQRQRGPVTGRCSGADRGSVRPGLGTPVQPREVVLTGPLADFDGCAESFSAIFGLEVQTPDLAAAGRCCPRHPGGRLAPRPVRPGLGARPSRSGKAAGDQPPAGGSSPGHVPCLPAERGWSRPSPRWRCSRSASPASCGPTTGAWNPATGPCVRR